MLVRKNLNKLQTKNYVIHFDKDNLEYYGVEVDDFELPPNIYGNQSDNIDMYLATFKSLKKNLGILLQGIKGSGKSLMAKQLMIQSKLPVLIINEPFCGNKFTDFMTSIDQEVVVFFDEFEKVYEDQKHQEELLTLFDGVEKSKKIFLLATNNNNLNEFFTNRPSRIRYKLEFNSISDEVLDEIIEHLLINKEYSNELKDIVYSLGEVGKDLLISIVEEVNLRGESPKKVIKTMNIEIPRATYDFTSRVDGVFNSSTFYGNPLASETLELSKWMHGVEYSKLISLMRTEKSRNKITLSDNSGNIFNFNRIKKYNSLDNI